MAHHDQVEQTEEAQRQRRGRQRQAAPGGFHDRLIKILAIALPMATGAIVAFLVIAPFSPRSEVSFILDRDKVEQVDERLRVDNATYRGADKKGRPFSLVADEAVQKSSKEGIVRLDEVIARILLADGPAQLTADGGEYTIADDYLSGRADRETTIQRLMKYSLHSRGSAERRIRFIDTYRSYIINYSLGRDMVQDWVEAQGPDHWSTMERLLGSQILPTDLL